MRRPSGLRAPAGRGEMEVAGLSAPTVNVFISSSLNTFRSQKRYSRSLTIAEFKVWPWGRGPEGRGQEEMEGLPQRREGARDKTRLQRFGTGPQRGGATGNLRFQRMGAGPEKIRGCREWGQDQRRWGQG